MLLLLPPSETKREGGVAGSRLTLDTLRFAKSLNRHRSRAIDALTMLSADSELAIRALGLGPTQHAELQHNRELNFSPTMPAIERYTGVLFDALDADSLDDRARQFAAQHLVVHSALFGLIGAEDAIPAYRLSHNSRLPELSLRSLWREPISTVLEQHHGLVIDLRSEAYAALGPLPASANSIYLRVVAEGSDGKKRAISHFNKAGKGRFVRAVLESGLVHESPAEVRDWASSVGMRVESGAVGELDLVV